MCSHVTFLYLYGFPLQAVASFSFKLAMHSWNLLCSRFAFDSCRTRSRTGQAPLFQLTCSGWGSSTELPANSRDRKNQAEAELPHHVDTLLQPQASSPSCFSLMFHTCIPLSHRPLLSTMSLILTLVKLPLVFLALFLSLSQTSLLSWPLCCVAFSDFSWRTEPDCY